MYNKKMPRFTRAFLFYTCLFWRSEKTISDTMRRKNPEITEIRSLLSPVFGKAFTFIFCVSSA